MMKLVTVFAIAFLLSVTAKAAPAARPQPHLRLVNLETSQVWEGFEGRVKKFNREAKATIGRGPAGITASGGVLERISEYAATTELIERTVLRNVIVVVERKQNDEVTYAIYVREGQHLLPCWKVRDEENLEAVEVRFTCDAASTIAYAKVVPTFELSFE